MDCRSPYSYYGKVITGKQFYESFPDLEKNERLIKVENPRDLLFESTFDENCRGGAPDCGFPHYGCYYRFIVVNNICCCEDRAFLPEKYYREVTLDPDCKVYIGCDHFGADKLILGEKKEIKDMDIWKNEDFCIKAVKCNKLSIISIPYPSIDVQLLAVKQSGYLIKYLHEKNIPISEEVKLEAVKNYGLSIEYIKDPSENIQIHAVQENGLAIRYIENPSENIQIIAVTQKRKRAGDVLSCIMKKNINVSEEVKTAAVEKSAWSIICINNPSKELQLYAVKKDGLIIKYITNPSEKVQLAAAGQKMDHS